MPSHKTPISHFDHYTPTPLVIFKLLSFAKLQAVESMIFNHVVLHSINFNNNSSGRHWIKISPSEFAKERAYTRQRVSEALGSLVKFGFIDVQECCYQTNSGFQKGREFKLVSNAKLGALHELLSSSALPQKGTQGDKSQGTPELGVILVGDNSQVTPRKARGDTLSGHRVHLVTSWLSPWGVKASKSLEKNHSKESLINIKEFINKFSDFEGSYLELYSIEISRRSFFKLELEIASLIRRTSFFQVYVAMLVNLFGKGADLGNTKVLGAFLDQHQIKLKEAEEKLRSQCDEVYFAIFESQQKTIEQNVELENFRKIFRQNVNILLTRMRLETSSSGIFIYDGFQKDALDIFERCNYNIDNFSFEVLKQLNLYFKAKILGSRGLNFVQSLEY